MIVSTTIMYLCATILVYICTLQKSKHQELFTEHDIIILPILTILGLFMLYMSVRCIDKFLLNRVFLIVFSIIGYTSMISNFLYLYEVFEYDIEERLFNIEFASSEFEEIDIKSFTQPESTIKRPSNISFFDRFKVYIRGLFKTLTPLTLLIYVSSLAIVVAHAFTKYWLLTDFISIHICFNTVREVQYDCTVTGIIQLTLLFLYDFFWSVFEPSKISEQIMSELDTPIKLIFPTHFKGYEMIGLGDIFIPAIYIAHVRKFSKVKDRYYMYYITFLGFCIGMGLAIIELIYASRPWPAMIFICPILLVFSLLSTVPSGNLRNFLQYRR